MMPRGVKQVPGVEVLIGPRKKPKEKRHQITRITPKQEAFARLYLDTGNATEAYKQAYDAKTTNNNSLGRMAYDLLRNVRVSARIEQIKAERAKRHEVTIDSLCEELTDAIEIAKNSGQSAAMIQGILAKAKLLGMLVDKIDAKATQFVITAPTPKPSTEDWLEGLPSRSPLLLVPTEDTEAA